MRRSRLQFADLFPDWTNPAHNATEMEEYRRLGEIGYVDRKKQASLDFLRRYPRLYLRLVAKRFIYTWTGFWSLRKDYLAAEPFTFPHIALTTTITVLLLVGAWRAIHFNRRGTLPLLLVLVTYPLVYYIAHSGAEYRHPIDPICVMFIGYLASSAVRRRTNKRAKTGLAIMTPAEESATYRRTRRVQRRLRNQGPRFLAGRESEPWSSSTSKSTKAN